MIMGKPVQNEQKCTDVSSNQVTVSSPINPKYL